MTETSSAEASPAVRIVALAAMVAPGDGLPVTNDAADARVIAMMGDRLLPYVDGIRVDQKAPEAGSGALDPDYWVSLRVAALPGRPLMVATEVDDPTIEDVFRLVLDGNAQQGVPLEPGALAPLLVAALRQHLVGE